MIAMRGLVRALRDERAVLRSGYALARTAVLVTWACVVRVLAANLRQHLQVQA